MKTKPDLQPAIDALMDEVEQRFSWRHDLKRNYQICERMPIRSCIAALRILRATEVSKR